VTNSGILEDADVIDFLVETWSVVVLVNYSDPYSGAGVRRMLIYIGRFYK